MIIQRPKYLQEIIDRKENGLIKVITGIRRVGKSYLLFNLFSAHLRGNGVQEDHIIKIQLDDRRQSQYRNPDTLLTYIETSIKDREMHYLLLDEVQMLDEFESVLLTLLHFENLDVYVTGSNSKFLSKDIITELRGRGDEIHVYPLSFQEFMSVYPGDRFEGWNEYYTYGGLPLLLTKNSDAQKSQYLKILFTETYIKDIISRHTIRHKEELETIMDIVASGIGSLTNPKRIADTFKTEYKSSLSQQTIKTYLDYLEDAFLINGVKRYDIKGRKYIGTPLKYYYEDVGLRNCRLNFRQQEENHIMENIIYIELRRRGFNVDIGVVQGNEKNEEGTFQKKQFEIDFVANLGNKRYYIQSAFAMPDSDKIKQEKKSLRQVKDNFRKIIIVKDPIKAKLDDDGILTISLFDFLLHDDSLDW